jgi:hypothetical protein
MDHDADNRSENRAKGVMMLGTIAFCAATGAGVGVFLARPALGALIGSAIGIVAGIWLVPGLFDDQHDKP